MKFLKKLLRLVALILLMLLATIGLGGGAPIPTSGRKENLIEIKAELVEEEQKDSAQLIKP